MSLLARVSNEFTNTLTSCLPRVTPSCCWPASASALYVYRGTDAAAEARNANCCTAISPYPVPEFLSARILLLGISFSVFDIIYFYDIHTRQWTKTGANAATFLCDSCQKLMTALTFSKWEIRGVGFAIWNNGYWLWNYILLFGKVREVIHADARHSATSACASNKLFVNALSAADQILLPSRQPVRKLLCLNMSIAAPLCVTVCNSLHTTTNNKGEWGVEI